MRIGPPGKPKIDHHGGPLTPGAAARVLTDLPRGLGLAVTGMHEEVTYDDLHGRANQIAHAILARSGGVPPGAVALLLDHDVDAIAAALGILKAGGHYVALGPSGSSERMRLVLADAGARVVVTQRRHLETAQTLQDDPRDPLAIVELADAHREPTAEVGGTPAPSDRAMIAYTSGSTGQPKGVWHDHASIAEGTRAYAELIEIRSADRLSLLHSLVTMASATTLWTGLLNGATIAPHDPRLASQQRLLEWIGEREITGLHLVPTLFRRLAAETSSDALTRLRFLRLGGESITRSDWELWRAHCHPASRLHVGFASTEVGLVRHGVYEGPEHPSAEMLPLGDPVPGKELLVVDGSGQPVPPGTVGRIVVRGRHLFGGYHGLPAETAQVRTVQADGLTVFTSGDLARYDRRGRLFHAGRVDAQVTIRGHRVEPAETEHALRRLPWVRDSAVVAKPTDDGDTHLAAFVVADDANEPHRRVLQAHLREYLPTYLTPSSVELLDALPLLPSGKVDRPALAARPSPPARGRARTPNEVEKTILEVWRRVLDSPLAGLRSDFFLDLGGDSLDAVEMLQEVGELFGFDLPLETLNDASTVETLAKLIQDDGWRPPHAGILVVNEAGTRVPVFGVCGLQGHALRLMMVGHALGADQPFYGLQPPGMDWQRAGCHSIEDMARHYRGVIRSIQDRGPYHLVGASFGGVLAFVIATQLEAEGENVRLLAMLDTKPPDCQLADRVDRAPRRDRLGGQRSDDPLVSMGLRVGRQHQDAMWRHVLTRPFGGEIVYFRCEDPGAAEKLESRARAVRRLVRWGRRARAARETDRRKLWSHFAAAGVRTVEVPDKHGKFHREPQFSAVVEELRCRLAITEPPS
ncbi:MAG: AMP-binding protein [Solirubrobacterales bacterium]